MEWNINTKKPHPTLSNNDFRNSIQKVKKKHNVQVMLKKKGHKRNHKQDIVSYCTK
jgi:hypothetical protein